MKKLLILTLFTCLSLLTACGGDDVAQDAKLSEEGKTVVEELGGPFDADEFDKFLADLPKIPGLSAASRNDLGEMSGQALNDTIINAAKDLGWDEERFLYVYAHTMTVVNGHNMEEMMDQMKEQLANMPEEQKAMMEQAMGNKFSGQMEAYRAEVDKQVPASEQAIVNENMDTLKQIMGM